MYTRPLHWFGFTTRIGQRWRVVLSTPSITIDLENLGGSEGCYAFTDTNASLVCLDIRYEWQKVRAALFHELCHVAADERDGVDVDFEEQAVTLISTPLLGIVERLPFRMRYPRRPKGFADYRKWALKVDPLE